VVRTDTGPAGDGLQGLDLDDGPSCDRGERRTENPVVGVEPVALARRHLIKQRRIQPVHDAVRAHNPGAYLRASAGPVPVAPDLLEAFRKRVGVEDAVHQQGPPALAPVGVDRELGGIEKDHGRVLGALGARGRPGEHLLGGVCECAGAR